MKEEDQQIAISEACGWQCSDDGYWRHFDSQLKARLRLPSGVPPDYLHDLNAMHDAEVQCLTTPGILLEYDSWLCKVTGYSRPICADAHERAEALLRTIGKWQDGTKP